MNPVPSLERQINLFQFKLQQALDLRDEEIDRLEETLDNYKIHIMELKRRIVETDQRIDFAKEQRFYDDNKINTELESSIANMEAHHHEFIQDLHNAQNEEIEELQTGFALLLAQSSQQCEKKLQKKINRINDEINETKDEIRSIRNSIDIIDNTTEEEVSDEILEQIENQNQIISKLTHTIEVKNQERLEGLKTSKEKLQTCLQAIDQMDKEHIEEIQDLKEDIYEIDKSYKSQVNKLKQRQQDDLIKLKIELKSSQDSNRKLLHAVKKMQENHSRQLRENKYELETMKMRYSAPVFRNENVFMNSDESKEIQEIKSKFRSKRTEVINKERTLEQARSENEELKRHLGKLRHNIRFARAQKVC